MSVIRHWPAALCAAGQLALSIGSACAADSNALPAVIVTATRTAQPLADTLADVRVIDAQAVRNAGASTLTELLAAHAGVEIAANGGPGQLSSVFIRGSNANHIVLLVDGVRLHSATAGLNAWENIPLAQIERIEVLRGTASSLYGADAIGGVVQIFTRRGERTQASVGAGSWRTRDASVGLGREIGSARLSVQAGYSESRGFSATNEGADALTFNPDTDPYRNKNLGVSLEHEWTAGHRVAGRVLRSEGDTFFDCGPGADDVNRQILASYSLETRHQIAASWLSMFRVARGIDDSAVAGNCAGSFRTDQDQFGWQNDIQALGGQVVAGAEWRRERVSSDTPFTQTSRVIGAAFAAHSFVVDAHRLSAGLRVDDNSQFGRHTTGRLEYGLQLTQQWRVSGAAGNAFKAPSFNDLYYPLSFGFSGNPNLRPERSRNFEAAVKFGDGAIQGGLVAFENRVRDLIAIDSTFSTVVNVNQARLRGATLNAAIVDPNWYARGEWTHQDAVDTGTGNRLARRARRHASASAGVTPGSWRAGFEWLAQGARFDAVSNAAASRLGGYGLLNAHAAYANTPELSVLVRLNNATDRRYELARGYNTPRRNVYVALEYATR